MKLALFVFADFPEVSASARRLHMLGKGLASHGHEVHIVVPQRFRPGPLYQEFDGLRVHWGTLTSSSAWNKPRERLAARLAAIRIIRHLAPKKIDWLLLSNPSLDGLPLLFVARRAGMRVMATYDDLRARPQRPTMEDRLRMLWLESADKLIPRLAQLNLVTSSFLEKQVRSIAPHIPIFHFPPVVDPDIFKPQEAEAAAFRATWQLGQATVISYLGSFWSVDGVKILLQAASELAATGERFRLVISGAAQQGLDCDDVSRLIEELNLTTIAIQTGWLTTADVAAAMSAADILVIPKLDNIANVAGMPAKLAEYMATSRPVVVSAIGDIPRYVTDHEDVLLCEPGNPQALAETLRHLIHDAVLRNKLATNARLTACRHFDYRVVASRLESVLAELATK